MLPFVAIYASAAAIPETMAEEIMLNIFSENGEPKKHLSRIVMESALKNRQKRKDMIVDMYRMMKRL